MPAKGLFATDHLPSIAVIDSQAVVGLAISPFEEDLSFFQHMFDDAGWKLLSARTRREAVAELSHGAIAVVVCERHLIDGNWKDVLSRLASISNPPRLIVVSHRSDDGLWTEVLNMGGFDLLRAPAHLSTTTPSPHSEQMKASMAANPGGRGIPHMSTESEKHR